MTNDLYIKISNFIDLAKEKKEALEKIIEEIDNTPGAKLYLGSSSDAVFDAVAMLEDDIEQMENELGEDDRQDLFSNAPLHFF